MKHFTIVLAITLFATFICSAQRHDENLYEMVPTTEAIPLILAQPDSPVLVERFLLARDLDGKVRSFYQVRNSGSRPIRSYVIARIFSDGSGYLGEGSISPRGPLQPQATVSNFVGKILKSTVSGKRPDSAPKLGIALITRIDFSDGTSLDLSNDLTDVEASFELLDLRLQNRPPNQR